MSYNHEAERIKSLFERKKRLDEEIVRKLMSSPHCLDEEPEKDEVYNFASSYFQSKRQLTGATTENEKKEIKGAAVLVECVLQQIERQGETSKHSNFRLLTKLVCDLSDEEVKSMPNDFKEKLFNVIDGYLKEMCS